MTDVSPWSAPELEQIAELVEARVGLCFAHNRCESLEQVVRQLMQERGEGMAEFALQLRTGGVDWPPFVERLTVGETYFFRDYEQFELLRDVVLPELAQRGGVGSRPRLWSAGCASGEEAYSLAILLDQHARLDGAFVLGSDLNDASLKRARGARYTRWSLRGVPRALLDGYFDDSEVVVVPPEISRHVHFERINLAGVDYPSPSTGTFAMDAIFCRNVLIYFGPSTIAHVARRLFDALRPDGVLFTGPSDPSLTDFGFVVEQVSSGTMYRRPPLARTTVRPRVNSNERTPRGEPPQPRRRPAVVSKPPGAADELGERRARAELAYAQRDVPALAALSAGSSEAWLVALKLRLQGGLTPARGVELECRAALVAHPLNAELHYLHALVLLELSKEAAALAALRSALYLEPGLAIAHFTLGSLLARRSEPFGAERAYRNAMHWLSGRAADELVPCAREISVRGLVAAAQHEIERLRSRSAEK